MASMAAGLFGVLLGISFTILVIEIIASVTCIAGLGVFDFIGDMFSYLWTKVVIVADAAYPKFVVFTDSAHLWVVVPIRSWAAYLSAIPVIAYAIARLTSCSETWICTVPFGAAMSFSFANAFGRFTSKPKYITIMVISSFIGSTFVSLRHGALKKRVTQLEERTCKRVTQLEARTCELEKMAFGVSDSGEVTAVKEVAHHEDDSKE